MSELIAKNVLIATMETALRKINNIDHLEMRLIAYGYHPEIAEMLHGNGFSLSELDQRAYDNVKKERANGKTI